MKRMNKIALIMLAVVLMAVCFIFGASAVTFDDYVNAGVVDAENQVVFRVYLNGCSFSDPYVRIYDFESGEFINKESSEFTEYYDKLPQSADEMNFGNTLSLPYLSVPGNLHFNGWKRVDTNELLKGNSYYVKDEDAGKIIEFIADVQPKFVEGSFSYIVTDGKATIVKVGGFDDGKVVIPDTLGGYEVAEIEDYAFNDLYKEFSVSETNKYFSVDESGALFNKDKTKIYAYPSYNTQTSYKIPDSVEVIGVCAFMQPIYLKDLELPENLRIIEEQGIRSSWFALDEIYLSEKVEKLEDFAIYDMPFLKKIYVEGMNTEFGETRAIGFIEIYFIDSVDKDYCADLWTKYMQGDESVVEELAGYLEYPAESYYKATIYCHAGSTAEAYATANGINCETIHFFKGEWTYDYNNNVRTRKCIHCDELETEELETPGVGDTGTWGDYEYKVLGDGFVEITKYNGSATELVIPSELGNMTVKGIGDDAFAETDIVNVTIPNGVIYIGNCAFSECFLLENINLPDTLEIIDVRAFAECGNLKSVIIPDSVKYLGEDAFYRCTLLETADVGDGVETIGRYAFGKCWSLKSIRLGKNVKNIEYDSIVICTNLVEVIVDEENPYFYSDENGALYDKLNSVLIKYPEANPAESYKIKEGTKEIGMLAFGNNLYLQNIEIPSSVKTIAEGAFQLSSGLKEITIPETVEFIGAQAFIDSFSLEKIYFLGENVIIDEPYLTGVEWELSGMTFVELAELFRQIGIAEDNGDFEKSDEIYDVIFKHFLAPEEGIKFKTVFYVHDDSKTYSAENYAIENGMPYDRCHFYADEWTYDYDNMIRYRECTFAECSARIEEPLESTNNGDVEIIEPVDPDTDFEVDEISGDNFLVVEETVTNGIEGDVEVLKAFDINLKNSDGVHVQPDGTVKVKLPNDWSKKGVYKVYRVNDDGTLTDMNAYRQGSHLVFETDHFSIYVIVFTPDETTEEEPETPDTPDEPEKPAEPDTSGCKCLCHKTDVFSELLISIFRFLTKLLGVFPTCHCGVAHY